MALTSEERKLRFIDAYVAAHLASHTNNGCWSAGFSSDVNWALDNAQQIWKVYQEVEEKQIASQCAWDACELQIQPGVQS